MDKTYLKLYRPTMFYFMQNYGLKQQDIEVLMFSYDLLWFTKGYLKEHFHLGNKYLVHKFPDLIKKNYINIYQRRAHNRAEKYTISQRGKLLVSRYYRVLEREEYLPGCDI